MTVSSENYQQEQQQTKRPMEQRIEIQNNEKIQPPLQPLFKLQRNLQTIKYLLKYLKIKINVQIITQFFKKTDGRDKTKKLIQYFLKYLILQLPANAEKNSDKISFKNKCEFLAKDFSLTRKTLRLFHWIESYAGVESGIEDLNNFNKKYQFQNKSLKYIVEIVQQDSDLQICLCDIFNNCLCIITDLCDDICFLGKIKVFNKKWEDFGGYYGSNIWWFSIMFDILITVYGAQKVTKKINIKREQINQKQSKEVKDLKELKEMEEKLVEKLLSTGKFVGDFIFCSCDVITLNNFRGSEFLDRNPQVAIFAGFFAGICSWYKYMKRTQPKE